MSPALLFVQILWNLQVLCSEVGSKYQLRNKDIFLAERERFYRCMYMSVCILFDLEIERKRERGEKYISVFMYKCILFALQKAHSMIHPQFQCESLMSSTYDSDLSQNGNFIFMSSSSEYRFAQPMTVEYFTHLRACLHRGHFHLKLTS